MNLQQKLQDLNDELKEMLHESWETGYEAGREAGYRDARDEISTLEAELDDFRADAARMAWMSSFIEFDEFDDAVALLKKHLDGTSNLRKAIDQARGQ